MWSCCFLTCCLAARQDRGGGESREVKRKVKKYNLDELKRELEALGVHIDEDGNKRKRKVKKTKIELQRLLIRELKKAGKGLVKDPLNGKGPTEHGDGFSFPMDIPEDVAKALSELDAVLDKEMEELEKMEKENEDNVKAVYNDILATVDSTLDMEHSVGERGAGESVVALVDQRQAGGYGGAGGPVLLCLPGPPRRKFYSVPMRRFCFTPIRRFWSIPRRWYQWADGISGI